MTNPIMASENLLKLNHLFKLFILIIVTLQLASCEEEVSFSLPCPVTNITTGAMLCCPISEALTTEPPDEDCVEILPITSASLLPEFWMIESFNLARHIRKNATSPVWQKNSTDDQCCCKEKTDFILPDMATTVSGSVSQVLQNSPGYVQPVMARMCKEMSCSRKSSGRKEISNCLQHWDATELYTEDSLHEGFMRKESIKVPSGCNCRVIAKVLTTDQKLIRAFQENNTEAHKNSAKLKDIIVTTIPAFEEEAYISYNPFQWQSFEEQHQNESLIEHQPLDSNSSYIHLPHANIGNVSRPQKIKHTTREQYKDKQIIQDSDQQISYFKPYSESSDNNNLNYERPIAGAIISQTNANQHPNIFNPNYYSQGAAKKQAPLSVGNNPQIAYGTLVPQDQLKELNSLASSAAFPVVNPQVINELNNLNSMMANYIKMGVFTANARAMTTTQIMENALTKVHSSQQMQALVMAERLMLLEIEHLRLSMNLMEMSYRNNDSPSSSSNTQKLSFVSDPTRYNIPVAFKPGGLNGGPLPFGIVELNTTNVFNVPQSNIHSPQGSGGTKPLVFGGAPVREIITPQVLPSSMQEDTQQIRGKPPLLKIETKPPKTQTPSKIDTPSPSKDPSPSSGVNADLRADPLPSNASRVTMLDDMLEEELHSAFANYIFGEAWTNDSCMVPLTINQSQSELYFLPSLIKDNFDIKAKGMLNIHKFAGRIIAGIIMCQFKDVEAALLDGRLTRAISGGIKVAQILNTQIRIMKEMMRGILETEDAKGLVNLLRWASRGTGSPSTEEFVSSNDAMDIENIMLVVKSSLREYVEFLNSKASKYPYDHKQQALPNPSPNMPPIFPDSNQNLPSKYSMGIVNQNPVFQSSASMSNSDNKLINISSGVNNSTHHDYSSVEGSSSTNKSLVVPLRLLEIKPQDTTGAGSMVSTSSKPVITSTVSAMPSVNSTASGTPGVNFTTSLTGTKATTSVIMSINTTGGSVLSSSPASVFRPGSNDTTIIIGVATTSAMPTINTMASTVLGANASMAMSVTSTTAAPRPITNTLVPALLSTTATSKGHSTTVGESEIASQDPSGSFKLLPLPDGHKYTKDKYNPESPYAEEYSPVYTENKDLSENSMHPENTFVHAPHPDPHNNYADITPKPAIQKHKKPYKDIDIGIEEFGSGFVNYDYSEENYKKPDTEGHESHGYKHVDGPGPEDYEGSGEYSPVSGSVMFPRDKNKDTNIISNLPKEYDPLDISPGSLMNLLFPNLR